jgi:hypothetical protein
VELAYRLAEHGAQARIEIEYAGGGVELLLCDRKRIRGRPGRFERLWHRASEGLN